MSVPAEQNGHFPEDPLPGSGLLFDENDTEQDPPAPPAADGGQEDHAAAELPALSIGGAPLAGLDAQAVESLLSKVALRRYTKRLEAEVDARLDQLDWSAVADGIESHLAGHVAEAEAVRRNPDTTPVAA